MIEQIHFDSLNNCKNNAYTIVLHPSIYVMFMFNDAIFIDSLCVESWCEGYDRTKTKEANRHKMQLFDRLQKIYLFSLFNGSPKANIRRNSCA